MKHRKLTAILLALCLLLTVLPLGVRAEETVASGSCGKTGSSRDVLWELTSDGTLTISGTGEMYDFNSHGSWYGYREQITKIVVESGVTSIGNYAFYECANVTSVTLPEGLTKIGAMAFYNCKGYRELELPETLEVIDDGAFAHTAFESIRIPAATTTIGGMVFNKNTALTGIWVDENNPNYSSDENGILFDKEKTVLLECYQGYHGPYTVPNTVETISGNAFNMCEGLTEITIPASVKEIQNSVFFYCTALEKVNLTEGLETIGANAFFGAGITEITIPASVTCIDGLFTSCPNFTTITFVGDAPEFLDYCFSTNTLTAYYPADNETWTEEVMQDYGGTITWVAYDAPIPMYRVYNPNSGEHFYTANAAERDFLAGLGWKYEGVAWNAPLTGDPVYRVYNPNSGDHHYTMSAEERDFLASLGWVYEGIGWYSAAETGVPMYRIWNPNADCGSHHYTTSEEERDWLESLGWKYEGIGWYGINEN